MPFLTAALLQNQEHCEAIFTFLDDSKIDYDNEITMTSLGLG